MKRVTRPSQQRARALALAAIRETFEETGQLYGSPEFGAPEVPAGSTWTGFAQHGVFPDLEALTFVARAVTPPRRPKRFDTRFFTVDAGAVAHTVGNIVGPESELVELVSVSFADARQLDLPTITKVILDEVEDRIKAGFGIWLPVPYYWENRGTFVREAL